MDRECWVLIATRCYDCGSGQFVQIFDHVPTDAEWRNFESETFSTCTMVKLINVPPGEIGESE